MAGSTIFDELHRAHSTDNDAGGLGVLEDQGDSYLGHTGGTGIYWAELRAIVGGFANNPR